MTPATEWAHRLALDELDERVRSRSDRHWLKRWQRKYDRASSQEAKRALMEERREWNKRRERKQELAKTLPAKDNTVHSAAQVGSVQSGVSPIPGFTPAIPPEVAASSSSPSSSPASGSTIPSSSQLVDQWGVPISSYGTVYPSPDNVNPYTRTALELYALDAQRSQAMLEASEGQVNATVTGMENIIEGLRNGYASKGLDGEEAKKQQAALHASLRAAIRAREERRRKAAALNQAHQNVLDELRRQEAIIVDRGQMEADSAAEQAFLQAQRNQSARDWAAEIAWRRAQGGMGQRSRRSGTGFRPTPTHVHGVDPYWFEQKSPEFTEELIKYNNGIRQQIARMEREKQVTL